MLHKDSIKIDEFVNIHNEKIKGKISKKDLAKNLRQIIKMKDVTLNLTTDPDIEVTLPCVAGEIDFGNLTFQLNLINNIRGLESYKKDIDYDDDANMSDYFEFFCESDRFDNDNCVAPHVDYGHPCLGKFVASFATHSIICDYMSMVNTLKDFIGSMDENSHYYYGALSTHTVLCYSCESMIRPIIYRHTLSQEDRDKEHFCKICEEARKR